MTVAARASESQPAAGLCGAASGLPWRLGQGRPICLEAVSLRPAQSLPVNVILMNTEKSKCEIHECVCIACIQCVSATI